MMCGAERIQLTPLVLNLTSTVDTWTSVAVWICQLCDTVYVHTWSCAPRGKCRKSMTTQSIFIMYVYSAQLWRLVNNEHFLTVIWKYVHVYFLKVWISFLTSIILWKTPDLSVWFTPTFYLFCCKRSSWDSCCFFLTWHTKKNFSQIHVISHIHRESSPWKTFFKGWAFQNKLWGYWTNLYIQRRQINSLQHVQPAVTLKASYQCKG